MAEPDFDKTVFVIMPFGEEGTPEREQSDDTYENIIRRAVEEASLGLTCIRADEITRSGSIIDDIIRYAANSRFVIADLTGRNPNVFYELGIRHSFSGRTILMAQSSDDLPFDVMPQRTIMYSKGTIERANQAMGLLVKFMVEMDSPTSSIRSPVVEALMPAQRDILAPANEEGAITEQGMVESSNLDNRSLVFKTVALSLELQGLHRVTKPHWPAQFEYWVDYSEEDYEQLIKKVGAVRQGSQALPDIKEFKVDVARFVYYSPNLSSLREVTLHYIVDTSAEEVRDLVLDLGLPILERRQGAPQGCYQVASHIGRHPLKIQLKFVDTNVADAIRRGVGIV